MNRIQILLDRRSSRRCRCNVQNPRQPAAQDLEGKLRQIMNAWPVPKTTYETFGVSRITIRPGVLR